MFQKNFMRKITFFIKTGKYLRHFLVFSVAAFAVCLLFFLNANIAVSNCSKYVYHSPGDVPEQRVGLLLGTGKYLSNGVTLNAYFTLRVNAAADLYHSGKIEKIIVSGDNGKKIYNEPHDMRDALIELGVKPEDIVCDYAGFRTLDSVVRAKEVFGVRELTVISQQFHCERAIYIGQRHDMKIIGYSAKDVGGKVLRRKQAVRESLSRALAWVDVHLLNRNPRYLGEQVYF